MVSLDGFWTFGATITTECDRDLNFTRAGMKNKNYILLVQLMHRYPKNYLSTRVRLPARWRLTLGRCWVKLFFFHFLLYTFNSLVRILPVGSVSGVHLPAVGELEGSRVSRQVGGLREGRAGDVWAVARLGRDWLNWRLEDGRSWLVRCAEAARHPAHTICSIAAACVWKLLPARYVAADRFISKVAGPCKRTESILMA